MALSAGGVGGLIGALAATWLGTRFGAGRVVIVSRMTTGAAWALMAMSTAHWSGLLLLSTGQALLGLSMGAENANEIGYWQAVTPDALQGRMNATRRSINRSMIIVGAPVGGVLGDAYGYKTMLLTAAGGFVVVALSLGASRFRNARIGETSVP